MNPTIIIDPTYCGPPDSGNGGYVCGLLASMLAGTVEVTLRRPPPLGKQLRVEMAKDRITLLDEAEVVAYAQLADLDLETPEPVGREQAVAASRRYLGFSGHPFPTCFVCGPQRAEGNGLHIFAGRVKEADLFAAPWTPDTSLADEGGWVRPEFVWAALDCPGAFAIMGDRQRKIVLGRMTARLAQPVRAGEECVVLGWPLGHEGRKFFSGTAVYNEQKELCALAKAVWLEIP